MQGTSTTSLTGEEQKAINEYNGKLAKWTKDESMARFILSQVIPNSMLQKIYSANRPVKDMWDMLVLESRSALAQVDLCVKLQNIHCHEKGDI
jgi:hypothetical protein